MGGPAPSQIPVSEDTQTHKQNHLKFQFQKTCTRPRRANKRNPNKFDKDADQSPANAQLFLNFMITRQYFNRNYKRALDYVAVSHQNKLQYSQTGNDEAMLQ